MVSESKFSKRRFSMGDLALLFGGKGARPPLIKKTGAEKKSRRVEESSVSREKEFLSMVAAGFASCYIWINGLNGFPILEMYVNGFE